MGAGEEKGNEHNKRDKTLIVVFGEERENEQKQISKEAVVKTFVSKTDETS